MSTFIRPKISKYIFENAIKKANLTDIEEEIIEYIRYIGTFTQPQIVKALNLKARPPLLSILCEICRKIGNEIPEHFAEVRLWSESVSPDGVRWDGDLICSSTFNIDGLRLAPEFQTTQFHLFAVHPEFFTGL
tara:strand:+ start:797 stop:1195 length:399 start_codon:yes stop_codon:yes gene_type:complete